MSYNFLVIAMIAEEAVKKVLALSPSVRVATIATLDGKLVVSSRRRSVKNLLTPSESKESLRVSAKNMKGRKKLIRKLGKCKYTLAEYAKIKRLVMYAGNKHIMFVTCSPKYDHMKIVKKIRSFR